jgi:CheY-like chemotaxis protein
MPGLNGLELCQKILELDPDIRVCFMSAAEVNIDALREVYPKVSFGCFVKKPITIEYLAEKLLAELVASTLPNKRPVVIQKHDDLVKMAGAHQILSQNTTQSSFKQIQFIICETCFWCASLVSQVPDHSPILNWHSCKERRIRSYTLL